MGLHSAEPSLPASTSRLGAWVISLGNAIEKSDALVKNDLEAILLAARGARFYSAIRSLGSIEGNRLNAYRLEGDLTKLEMDAVLKSLHSKGAVDIQYGVDGKITFLTIAQASFLGVYDFAASFFEELEPDDCARVALGILDATMELPLRYDNLIQTISIKFGVNQEDIKFALNHLEIVGALQISMETDNGQKIVYNPLQFSNTDTDALQALTKLNSAQRDQVLAVVEHVKEHPGVPLPAHFRGQAYDVVKSCGIIDVSQYAPKPGEDMHEFPTLQTTWKRVVYSDAKGSSNDLIHDAKALLASIRYGEHFAESWGGKIRNPYVLLSKLFKSGSVGPATNIGSDYPLIARRGIINIVEHPSSIGRYSMELVKSDVLEPVLKILEQEERAEAGDVSEAIADGAYMFEPPEMGRRHALREEIRTIRDDIIFTQLLRRRSGSNR